MRKIYLILSALLLSGSMMAADVTSTVPAHNATNVAVGAEIAVLFSEDVTTWFDMFGWGVRPVVTIIDADGVSVTGVDFVDIPWGTLSNKVVITHGTFEKGKVYTVSIPPETVSGYAAFYSDPITWSFATETDAVATLIVSRDPAEGATNAVPGATVSITFSGSVAGGDLSGITVNSQPATGAGLDNEDARLVIQYNFVGGTEYTVFIPAVAVPSYGEDITWHFTTRPDLAFTNLSPANNAENVELDAEIAVTFNRYITTWTESDGGTAPVVTVIDDAGVLLSVNYTPILSTDPQTNKLVIARDKFRYGKKYTVTIPANTVPEYAAITSEPITWEFTMLAVTIVSQNPEEGAANLAPREMIQINFSKGVAGGDWSGITVNSQPADSVKILGSNAQLQIYYPFVAGTAYTVFIPAVAVPNYDQDITWHFTTTDLWVESMTPANNATNVALDAEVAVLFSKDVTLWDGVGEYPVVTIKEPGGAEVNGVSYDLTSDNKLVIDHAAFGYDKKYTVSISANTVPAYAAVYSQPITWEFTTIANSIQSTTPANNATDVAPDAEVAVLFGNNMTTWAGTGESPVVTIKDLNGVEVNDVSYVPVVMTPDNKLVINHATFGYDTEYTVSISANTVPAYNQPITWSFKTVRGQGLQTPQQAVSVYPTLSKGSLTVKTPSAAIVKVRDLSGRILAAYSSTGNLSIDLPYENGIYLIVVENGKSVSTHKVVLNN
jgi:methionine-rich copper-binding protein CopC